VAAAGSHAFFEHEQSVLCVGKVICTCGKSVENVPLFIYNEKYRKAKIGEYEKTFVYHLIFLKHVNLSAENMFLIAVFGVDGI